MSLERSFATNRNASSNSWTASSENWKVTFEEGGRLLAKNAGFIQTYICNQNLELCTSVSVSFERSFATNRNASSDNWTASSENWKVTFEEGGRLLAKNAGFIQTYICNQNLELHIQVFQSSICTYSAVV